jgi:hypothetical protein
MGMQGFYTVSDGMGDKRDDCGAKPLALPPQGMIVFDSTIRGVEWCKGDVLSVKTQLSCLVPSCCEVGATVFLKRYIFALEVAKFPVDRIPKGIVESFTEVFGDSGGVNYIHPRPVDGLKGIVVLSEELLTAEKGKALHSSQVTRVKDGVSLVQEADGERTLPLVDCHVVTCVVFTHEELSDVKMWLSSDSSCFRPQRVG